MTLENRLRDAMRNPGTGWSMGSFGAIAEFHHVAGDPAATPLPGCGIVTARGGIRLENIAAIRPVAWEGLSPRPHRWQQGVALCLPEGETGTARRSVLTELGPDTGALRDQDREAVLFDLGLDQPQVDFCVRTSDPALIAALRAECGRGVFESHAMAAILPAHPHRVALTGIGRVEVFQKIGGPDTGGVSPPGPHTHVLPKLLRSRRTHSANTPIPPGLVPVAGLHPESPVMDTMGADRDFDAAAFADFQRMLAEWGDGGRNALKARVWAALAEGVAPGDFPPPDDRHARTALRVALRQAERRDGPSPALAAWRAAFDRDTAEPDEDAPGH
ncbi:hypothetical protein SAMN04488021_13427 [Paracoccus aminovorans]|uniref:Uncharacterized protein n=1 Tax=Paracoccus aminovorans TaxID=34004 RepID=A0A1I3CXL7_9RHOB|nr:hypothetical protein [Paracoccus aminovorans]CQR83797.1 hypothetical protein JCM7685_pAMV1p0009 [Paracoccus aminovorans]SFH79310.1 hypothetical protein SAMN04488021_13427 [Paracoccus aminovorans]